MRRGLPIRNVLRVQYCGSSIPKWTGPVCTHVTTENRWEKGPEYSTRDYGH